MRLLPPIEYLKAPQAPKPAAKEEVVTPAVAVEVPAAAVEVPVAVEEEAVPTPEQIAHLQAATKGIGHAAELLLQGGLQGGPVQAKKSLEEQIRATIDSINAKFKTKYPVTSTKTPQEVTNFKKLLSEFEGIIKAMKDRGTTFDKGKRSIQDKINSIKINFPTSFQDEEDYKKYKKVQLEFIQEEIPSYKEEIARLEKDISAIFEQLQALDREIIIIESSAPKKKK